jgi:DNA polymerase-3 subunit epsilon
MDFDQADLRPPRRQKDLPTFYYHEHFLEMLEFVVERYEHVLAERHRQVVRDFRRLTLDEQRLYVRLVNRKGQVFDAAKLRYPELGEMRPLLAALRAKGWLVSPRPEHYDAVLRFLTRADILDTVTMLMSGVSRSLKKAEAVDFARRHVPADAFLERIPANRIVVQGHCREVRFLLYLYFGRLQDGLSQFTMRDLGLVRVNDSSGSYEPRFAERAEAEAQFEIAELLRAADRATGAELREMAGRVAALGEPDFASVAAARDALCLRLGRRLERADHRTLALDVYRAGESTACNERVVRLLLSADRKSEARAFLERCINEPRNDEERLFAEDLYARKFDKKRTSIATDQLRAADRIDLDESQMGTPERAAAAWYEARGHSAYRVENSLWRSLFGLLFWDEVTSTGEGGSSSPFDFLPKSLVDGSFRERNPAAVTAAYDAIAEPGALKRRLLKAGTLHYGRPNGVFRWRQQTLDALFALADHGEAPAIRVMLDRFIDNYLDSRYGYPDLMLVDTSGVRFVEIKAEGDALRRNQLLRLEQLRAAGFRADVVRVRWVLDPEQDYVVVDVETTGGRGQHHRVTEIGAVRVRNGRTVEEFSTLLNPQRSIPPNITRLTGITPEMVMGAPYFADIADELERFLGDAIFVAHNVEFDYGFIAREFRRLGRSFRMPKLCTCASMRRLYPGRKSYSLDNLCRDFGIALDNHHRALCDAQAAAELLVLINERRGESLAND